MKRNKETAEILRNVDGEICVMFQAGDLLDKKFTVQVERYKGALFVILKPRGKPNDTDRPTRDA
jgi:hypothetical protein